MNLRDKFIKGISWGTFVEFASHLFQIPITIILIRLLDPSDFGIMAMALTIYNILYVFSDVGVGVIIVQKQDLSKTHLSIGLVFTLFISILLVLFSILMSGHISDFYNVPVLKPVIVVVAISFFIASLSVVHRNLLVKQMKFKIISIIEIVSNLTAGISAVVLAAAGYGVWSLVLQILIKNCINTVSFIYKAWFRPSFDNLDTATLREMFSISYKMLYIRIADYLGRNIDDILIGKFLGDTALGYYSLAYRLMMFPLEKISYVIYTVLFPALSEIQNDFKRLQTSFIKVIRYIVLIVSPMMAGLFTVAPELVLLLYGEKWAPSIFIIKVLCPVGIIESVERQGSIIFTYKKKYNTMVGLGTLFSVSITMAVLLGLRRGINGVGVAFLAVHILSFVSIYLVSRSIDFSFQRLMSVLGRCFLPSFIMFLLLIIMKYILVFFGASDVIVIISLITAGVAVYYLLLMIFNPAELKEARSLLKKVLM